MAKWSRRIRTGRSLSEVIPTHGLLRFDDSTMNRLQSVGEPKPFPTSLKPMLATLVDKPFSDPRWLFEPKLDGFRILAFIRDGGVTLRSRK